MARWLRAAARVWLQERKAKRKEVTGGNEEGSETDGDGSPSLSELGGTPTRLGGSSLPASSIASRRKKMQRTPPVFGKNYRGVTAA